MLPHRYPFRLVDRPAADKALWRLSAGSALLRPNATLAPVLLLELLAQTALVVLSREPERGAEGGQEARGYLVGIDRAELAAPGLQLMPGDDLLAEVTPAGTFARLVRIDGEVWRGEALVLRARLSLALETSR